MYDDEDLIKAMYLITHGFSDEDAIDLAKRIYKNKNLIDSCVRN